MTRRPIGVFLVAIISIIIYWLASFEDPSLQGDISIIKRDQVVENHLSPYKELLGEDYHGYRNHVYRVLTFSLHFLHGYETYRDIIAAALVYHDIGLWTADNHRYFFYNEPSMKLATERLKTSQLDLVLVKNIIHWHHKITPFEGDHADIVNAVRKADWADTTFGLVHHGLPRRHIAKVRDAVREAGFQRTWLDFNIVTNFLHHWNMLLASILS
jgi:hypothetical protein